MKSAEAQTNAVEKRYVERFGQALARFERVVLPKSELFVSPIETMDAVSELLTKFEDLARRGYEAGFRLGAKAAVIDLEKQGIPLKISIESTGNFPDEFTEAKQRTINVIQDVSQAFSLGYGQKVDITKLKTSANACLTTVIHKAWMDAYLGLAQELKTYVHKNY
jgi:hypothetical protein